MEYGLQEEAKERNRAMDTPTDTVAKVTVRNTPSRKSVETTLIDTAVDGRVDRNSTGSCVTEA